MGFFGKLFKNLFQPSMIQAEVDAAMKYAGSSYENELDILPCYDNLFASSTIQPFLNSSEVEVLNVDNTTPSVTMFFRFDNSTFRLCIYRHYGRTVNVGFAMETEFNDENEVAQFCNTVNLMDMNHQIGWSKNDDGKIYITVVRMFLFTPVIGNSEGFTEGLRQLRSYAMQLSKKILPNPEDWKQYALSELKTEQGEHISTADEIIFADNDENMMSEYFNRVVLSENATEIHIQMPHLISDGMLVALEDVRIMKNGHTAPSEEALILYKDRPYNFTLKAIFKPKGDSAKINEKALKELCSRWNCRFHFCLSTICWNKSENGLQVELLMHGLLAQEGNSRTERGIFVLYEKTLALIYGKVFS